MGLKANNRYRQSRGKLLELTKQQQIARQEWQSHRNPDWTDKMIVAPAVPDGVMSWGFCRAFDFELGRFTHFDLPGSVAVAPVSGTSQVIKSDTTDKISRSKSSRRRSYLSLFGD